LREKDNLISGVKNILVKLLREFNRELPEEVGAKEFFNGAVNGLRNQMIESAKENMEHIERNER
jgi:hypothetical protein